MVAIVDLTLDQENINTLENRIGLPNDFTKTFLSDKYSSELKIYYSPELRKTLIKWNEGWKVNNIRGVIRQTIERENISVILVDNDLRQIIRDAFSPFRDFPIDRYVYEKETFFEMFKVRML